jgi:class 3 adenylate cyclase
MIDDDTELVFNGPIHWIARPMSYGTLRRLMSSVVTLYVLAAIGGLPLLLGWVEVEGSNRALLGAAMLGAVLSAAGLGQLYRSLSAASIERWFPSVSALAQASSSLLIVVAIVAVGPNLGVTGVYYVEAPALAFAVMRPRYGAALTAFSMGAYALALALQDDPVAPAQQVLIVLSAAVATGVLVGALRQRSEDARLAEREAKRELADLNQHLELRVAQQVEELERTGRLRRFLAPQVADVVMMSGPDESLLQPHRRDVAVLFCDLRGFTRFTNVVDAETVVAVLAEYYAAVGTVLEAHGATIGGYDGDGIMAYLGDPIPRPDAASAGIAVARQIGAAVDALVERWHADGHDLGYGIGLAYGPATLGVVGFDGRFDYTALGVVVNLAARLCSDAAPGEILVDAAVRDVAGDAGTRHRGDVALKGFDGAVATYILTR